MFTSLLGLLSFQVYWISSVYTQKREALEAEIKEAFSKSNNGLLIRKLGDISGVNVVVTSTGGFFSADTMVMKKDRPNIHGMERHGGSRTLALDAKGELLSFSETMSIDTIITEVTGTLERVTSQLQTSVFMEKGEISEADFGFMDSLLQAYLEPIEFDMHYKLSFGSRDEGFEFTGGGESFTSEEEVKSFIQPISFGSSSKMAKLEYPEKQLRRSSLSSIWLIVVASVVMLALLVSAWYYIVRSLQRQYQLTQMKDDFISNMTHELKTPVTASSLALEVIAKHDKVKTDNGLTDLIGVAKSEQERMLAMIDTILDSTTQNGVGNDDLEDLLLNEELEAVTETIRMKVNELGGSLSVELPKEELWVKASQVHLQNAMINILENAIKYTKDAPEIEVTLKKDGHEAHLSMSDEGIGISREDQKRIFEKFFRVSTGNVHTVKGYGLGLSYTKAVIEKLGGSIDLESQPGNGTTFNIRIPLHEG